MRQIASRFIRLDLLGMVGIMFAVAIALHGTDHMRQARGLEGLTSEVLWSGAALAVIAFAVQPLLLTRHRCAALLGAVVGLATAVVVASSHLAPQWSAFSDPYWNLPLDAYSWIVMLAEVISALVVGVVGIKTLRAHAAQKAQTQRRAPF